MNMLTVEKTKERLKMIYLINTKTNGTWKQ